MTEELRGLWRILCDPAVWHSLVGPGSVPWGPKMGAMPLQPLILLLLGLALVVVCAALWALYVIARRWSTK